ncbi:hypothetical protein [Anaerotruncus colihominis]|uniref:hypothetical protein n=1 Tax=Anaerotruncus colihominis TaxID=169435 RepID=UPI0029427240|nr:hypothetical protein [Anaerotruncus colihominis]
MRLFYPSWQGDTRARPAAALMADFIMPRRRHDTIQRAWSAYARCIFCVKELACGFSFGTQGRFLQGTFNRPRSPVFKGGFDGEMVAFSRALCYNPYTSRND